MDIRKIKKLYDQNRNLTEYFKTTQNKDSLNSQEIELIYDLQSGNYSKNYENNKMHREYKDKFTDEIVFYLNNLNFKFDSILEAGIGEGTTFVNVIQKLDIPKLKSFGLDISWSRLSYANKFLKKHSIKNTKLVTGLLENLPFLENSIDIVYTAHSIEPNGGKEKEILKELFRITKNYLILLEPSYEFGNDEQKERMNRLSYAKNLNKCCEELGYKIVKHELLKNHSVENNKTEIIIIEKSTKKTKTKDFLACPETKTKLFKNKNFYYSAESFYSYPILENIICLNSKNKILSTKLEDFITLDKTHPRYNETMFLRSLEEPIDEKIKDMYCPNCIGFWATEENLKDIYFITYIKELMLKFPNAEFKGFYLYPEQKETANIIFKNINSEFTLVLPKNIYDLAKNTEIFLCNEIKFFDKKILNQTLAIYCKNIFLLYIWSEHSKLSLLEYDKILIETKHPILKNPEYFGLNDIYLKENNYSVSKILSKILNFEFNEINLVEEVFYYKFIYFTLNNNNKIKNINYKINKTIFKNYKI